MSSTLSTIRAGCHAAEETTETPCKVDWIAGAELEANDVGTSGHLREDKRPNVILQSPTFH